MAVSRRIVDLSHVMTPGAEEYGLVLESRYVDDVYPQYRRRPDVHYILQTIQMSSHVGTHIEFPRHFDPDGLDAASYPLDRLIGPACVLDFRHKADDEAITAEDLLARGDLIRTGDIVFIWTGRHVTHNTPSAHGRPYMTPEAVRWLVDTMRVPVIGVDATGIEVKGTDYHPNHTLLLKERGCALIEAVGDLGQLQHDRFEIWILPLKMRGLDSSPIRLIAVEEADDSEEVPG